MSRGVVRGAAYEDGWQPWGLPMYAGMALHALDTPGHPGYTTHRESQAERERRYPANQFVQNARRADELIGLHKLALSMPVHDRPMHFCFGAGAYGRPDGGLVQPHALWEMEHADD